MLYFLVDQAEHRRHFVFIEACSKHLLATTQFVPLQTFYFKKNSGKTLDSDENQSEGEIGLNSVGEWWDGWSLDISGHLASRYPTTSLKNVPQDASGRTQECANIAKPRSICLTHSDVDLDFSVVHTRIFLASDIGDKKVQTCEKANIVCVNISQTSKLDDEEEELDVVQTMENH